MRYEEFGGRAVPGGAVGSSPQGKLGDGRWKMGDGQRSEVGGQRSEVKVRVSLLPPGGAVLVETVVAEGLTDFFVHVGVAGVGLVVGSQPGQVFIVRAPGVKNDLELFGRGIEVGHGAAQIIRGERGNHIVLLELLGSEQLSELGSPFFVARQDVLQFGRTFGRLFPIGE